MPFIEALEGARRIRPPIEPIPPPDLEPMVPRLMGARGVISLPVKPKVGLEPSISMPPDCIAAPGVRIAG
ncbi:MAG: hypothetical protein JO161_02660 [Planctomycetaceae bacterium]|nr:hypothetical protein [Planctomycetaceae bacterium]